MKKRDWKTYNCSKQNCKNKRYNKKLKLCKYHYQRSRKDIKKIYNIDKRFKHEPKHYRDLKRFRIKYKYVAECVLLVKWQQEYDEADNKKQKIIEARKRYIIKSKYSKLSPDLLSNFDNSSDINCQVVKDYKEHIKYLEAFDWRSRIVLKGRSKMKYLSQTKKKEEEENDEQI